jgi:hypothetical protein
MVIKYTKIFGCNTLQNLSKFGFLVWKETIWQPCLIPTCNRKFVECMHSVGESRVGERKKSRRPLFHFEFVSMARELHKWLITSCDELQS